MPDSKPTERPQNPQTDRNEGQEIHLHWGKDGKGRPGLNQHAEEELEETAELIDTPTESQHGRPS